MRARGGRASDGTIRAPPLTLVVLKNDTLLRALLRQPTPYTPVWLMRQAGRYLPEYNTTRSRAGSFLALARNPDLATEVTLQPLGRFGLDAAIVFSDILTLPDAMGLGLSFAEGEGPRLAHPLREEREIRRLAAPDPREHLGYVLDTLRQVRAALNGSVPLIGFCGSPYTLASYMVEGGASSDFHTIKTMLYSRPDLLHRILEVNCGAATAFLNAQIEAGAQVVMIFDTWGGALAPAQYREFSLHYMQRIVTGLTREHEGRRVPSILFTKGGGGSLEALAASGCDAIGVDWTVDLRAARDRIDQRAALQGNLDPAVLLAGKSAVRSGVEAVLAAYGKGPGHVFNLGHGVSQFTPPDSVAALVEAVHELSPAYH